jgi:hypothetical protein
MSPESPSHVRSCGWKPAAPLAARERLLSRKSDILQMHEHAGAPWLWAFPELLP